MKKFGKKVMVAAVCAGVSLLALTGCASSSMDKNAVVATLNGEDVSLGEVLVSLRYGQASTESYLGGLFGEGTSIWTQDLMGNGVPYGVSFKEQAIESYKNMLIMEDHMADYNVEVTEEEKTAIADAAAQFVADNDEKALKAMCADEETVGRVLTLYTIEDKMRTAIEADVDTNVTDEEAAQKKIEYVLFSTAAKTDEEGNSTELTDEEKAAVKQQAQDVIDKVKAGAVFADALKEVDEEKNTMTNTYGKDSVLSEALTEAADALKDGEICAEPVETDNGWYVVQMVSTFDEEATAQEKESIISTRKNDLYNEVLEGWAPESFEINSKVWDKVTFDDKFLVKQEETEAASEETTEAVSEAASEEATEAVSEAASEETTEAVSETAGETEA